MAQFDTTINVLVNAQKAFKTLEQVEKKVQKLNDPRGRTKGTRIIREEKRQARSQERSAERALATEIKLVAAAERRETIEKALNRAGIENNKDAAERVKALQKAGDAGKGRLSIQNAVNAGLEKELQKRREISRTELGKERGLRQRSGFNDRINRLSRSNLTDGSLAEVRSIRDRFSTAVNKGELDEAKRLNAQLSQKLKLLERINKVERPGTLSGGARSSLNQGPARSILGSPQANKAKFDFYQSELTKALANVNRTEQAYEKQLQTNTLNNIKAEEKAELASIDRVAAAERAQNKRTNRENKEERALARAKEIGATRRENKAQQKVDRERTRKKTQSSSKLNNLGAAVGFPLLFGGGLGSVAGGAIGALTGGFGGSILGSALGQQLDALAAAADKTAQALRNPIDNLDALVQALGIAGTALEKQIQTADRLGLSVTAALTAQQKFESKFGSETTNVFTALAKDFTNFNNDLTALGVTLQKLVAGPLGGLLRAAGAVARSFSGSAEVESLKGRLSPENRKAFEEELGGSGFKSQKEINELLEKYKGTLDGSKTAVQDIQNINQAITDEYNRQQSLLERQTAVVQGQLVNRRDTQAVLQGSVAVLTEQNKLEKISVELSAAKKLTETETTKEKIKQLEIDKKQTQEALKQAEAAQANAKALAERQIRQERRGLSIQEFQLKQQIDDATTKSLSLRSTEAKQYELLIKQIDEQYQTTVDVLAVQEAVALEGKNELEVRKQITENFKKQNDLAQQRAVNAKIEAIQTDFLRKDRLQAIADQRELNKLTAKNAAIKAIDSNDPERTASFAGAGLGFFAESALIEANVIRDSAAQLEIYNEQIADLQKRLKELDSVNIKDKRVLSLKKQLGDLENIRNLYMQLQPAIDAARIKQAQFNDALAAVTPGINALVGGLQDVVAGTKTAEEAFADFLNTIADQLINTAATMIAQYIAIGLAKAFAGMSSPSPQPGDQFGSLFTGIRGKATGGPVDANTPYIVGEKGPELFIPGVTGTITNNDQFQAARNAMGSGAGSSEAFAENSDSIATSNTYSRERTMERESRERSTSTGTMLVETQVINNVEYVSKEQLLVATAASAKEARAQVFSDMRKRPATRRSLGLN